MRLRSPQSSSPHHSDVFSQLPALLMRELDSPAVAAVLEGLVAAGWRPAQLRYRVGGAPSQGSVEGDAAHLLGVLRGLTGVLAPDLQHLEDLRERDRARTDREAGAPEPASPEAVERHLARMRAQLGVQPRRRREVQPRLRPSCSLCDGEGAFFVTHDVHLCSRCVAMIAAGEVRLHRTG